MFAAGPQRWRLGGSGRLPKRRAVRHSEAARKAAKCAARRARRQLTATSPRGRRAWMCRRSCTWCRRRPACARGGGFNGVTPCRHLHLLRHIPLVLVRLQLHLTLLRLRHLHLPLHLLLLRRRRWRRRRREGEFTDRAATCSLHEVMNAPFPARDRAPGGDAAVQWLMLLRVVGTTVMSEALVAAEGCGGKGGCARG